MNKKPTNLGQEILTLLREKAEAEHEYFNPHFLSKIVSSIYEHYELEDEVVDKWIEKMWSA